MNTILNLIPLVMGLGFIDENLDGLLNAMKDSPDFCTGYIMGWAKIIGCCIALGVGANECYQMILGRRGMDVMKIIHIVIISFCITFSGWIAHAAKAPGIALENVAKEQVTGQSAIIDQQQMDVMKAQAKYLKALVTRTSDLKHQQMEQEQQQKTGIWAKITGSVDDLVNIAKDTMTALTLALEQGLCEVLSLIIRFLGELLLQISIYGLLVAERIFINIMGAFAPLMFALSLSPHFKSAWSQWLSKYISISLWGFACYICVYYAMSIIRYNLDQDLIAYETLLANVGTQDNLESLGVVGIQALGSTCMYVVGCLIGVKVISMVPEVCSWLIPGGVSSSAGQSIGGVGNAGASAIGGYAGGLAGSAAGAAVSGAGAVVSGTINAVGDTYSAAQQAVINHYGNPGSNNLDSRALNNWYKNRQS